MYVEHACVYWSLVHILIAGKTFESRKKRSDSENVYVEQ